MRIGELFRVSLKDFDKNNLTLILRRTKVQRLRVVPYGEHIRTTLIQYIKAIGYFPKDTLIESYKFKDQPISLPALHYLVRQVAARSGIKKKITALLYAIHNNLLFESA